MTWRDACVWSSWALLPMVAVLFGAGSDLGALYLLSAAVSHAYHATAEVFFVRADHGLAWAAIVANFWLAWHTRDWRLTAGGVAFVLVALAFYWLAHADDRADYDRQHTFWHLCCGAAGLLLALGYVRGMR